MVVYSVLCLEKIIIKVEISVLAVKKLYMKA
jgi:hypothetical protein